MLIVIAVGLLASPASAEPLRVAVLDWQRLYAPGGIRAWLDARARLDKELPELVEDPNGKTHDPWDNPLGRAGSAERLAVREAAKALREKAVLGAIEEDVEAALGRFARARGIDLILEPATALYVGPRADITTAFIAYYNTSKRKPARR